MEPERMNPNLKHTAYRNLVAMVMSDHQVREEEKAFLESARGLLGLSEEEAREDALETAQLPIPIRVPEADADRETVFRLMVHACTVDGALHRKEESLLRGIAPQFKVSSEALDEMIGNVEREPDL